MARPLRLDLPGALHHVTNRGNEQKDIFRSDEDRLDFLDFLVEEKERCNWIIHDYVLMHNHFHLVVETPEGNLSKGMQRVQSRYAQRFNWRHDRKGHLFGGRFKSILAESESYLLELSRYVNLNPVRAHMVDRPEQYRWSSYRAKIGLEEAPAWLSMQALDSFGTDRKDAERKYGQFVEAKVGVEYTIWDELVGQIYLGSPEFIERVQERIDEEPRSSEHPRPQRDVGRPPLEAIKAAVIRRFEMSESDLRSNRGDLSRMVFAKLGWWEGLRPLREIATELDLRSAGHVSILIQRCTSQCENDPKLLALIEDCVRLARVDAPPLPEHYLSYRENVIREAPPPYLA
jgi:putative transposase